MSARYVVVEWNQASGQPALFCTTVFDDEEEAKEIARVGLTETRQYGRRERYSVFELGDEVWEDSEDDFR